MSVITQDGWTALMLAAANGHRDVAVELMKSGADLNLQNNVCRNFFVCTYFSQTVLWSGYVCVKVQGICNCDHFQQEIEFFLVGVVFSFTCTHGTQTLSLGLVYVYTHCH